MHHCALPVPVPAPVHNGGQQPCAFMFADVNATLTGVLRGCTAALHCIATFQADFSSCTSFR